MEIAGGSRSQRLGVVTSGDVVEGLDGGEADMAIDTSATTKWKPDSVEIQTATKAKWPSRVLTRMAI
jgi:hypothetical protein